MYNILKLIISIVVCQLAGFIGMLLSGDSISSWYATLVKPDLNPPNSIFGPVWTVLYILMGISMFLIWKEGLKNKEVKSAFTIFIIQLIFNIIWSAVFFGMQSPVGGLVVIIILWILILLTILRFMKISRVAGILLIPYLLWVSFATYLNFSIYNLN